MSRMIMNFEAVTEYVGRSEYDEEQYEVQLMVNHHVIYRWPITPGTAYLIRDRQGYLEREVASHLFGLLNTPKVTVKDVNP